MLKFYCSIHTVTKQGHTAGRKNMLWYCTAARQGEVCKKKKKKTTLSSRADNEPQKIPSNITDTKTKKTKL